MDPSEIERYYNIRKEQAILKDRQSCEDIA